MMKWLRVCVHCSGGWPLVDFMCDTCWKALSLRIVKEKPRRSPPSPFPVGYLWEWENEKLFSDVLYGLKYALFPEVYLRFSSWMVQSEILQLSSPKPQWIAFPIKEMMIEDHAFQLAKALSEALQARLLPIKMTTSEGYKRLGREERFRARKALPQKRVKGEILFVDDVYTTGATARQAWQALGRPSGFRAAVLAYKRPSG